MNIITTPRFRGTPRTESLEDFAARSLDGGDYDRGQIETIEATTRNNSRAIGRLLAALVEKGTLGLDEVPGILGTLDKIEPAP